MSGVYGRWAGRPNGVAEDESRCIAKVYRGRSMIGYQCERKRGHGLDGLYCRQHAKQHPQPIPSPAEGSKETQ